MRTRHSVEEKFEVVMELYWTPLYLYHSIVETCLYRLETTRLVEIVTTRQEMID